MVERADPEVLRKESPGGRVGADPSGMRPSGPGLLHTLALLVWGVLILAASVALAGETGFWWLVLVFGAGVPIALVAQANRGARGREARLDRGEVGERELLEVLGRHGEVGPAVVAVETSLTITQADGMLDALAKKGYLEVKARDGMLAYALPGRDLRRDEEPPSGTAAPTTPGDTAVERTTTEASGAGPVERSAGRGTVEPLVEPLTERELEVLELLGSGRTNREIASDLFISVGTIKAHTANIYRKLGARSRAEALARAGELGLRPA